MSSEERPLSRREFVRIAGAGAAFCALGCCCGQRSQDEGAPKAAKRIPIALQLYSVRGECEKDLPSTVAAVGKMGYEAVEFAGYYGRSAKELRALLDENKLKCCGTHTGLDTLLGDNLKATIEFNQILGNKFLIVPGLPGERTSSAQAWLDTAKLFNELAEKVKPHGMQVGYHNHSAEFQAIDGQVPWDLFFGNTRADVVMQFDSGNAMHGGGDPVSYIKRYPGRATTVHLKEFSKSNPKALILEGDMKWDEFFQACETIGGTEWYIVEYESDAYPPLVSVQKCLENLRKKGK
jgi:sugar phosphate isomerase/epimerase